MSKKKAAGKARQHTRPVGKRLGVKVSHGESVTEGQVLVRQRGTKMHPAAGVSVGRDFTLYSLVSGIVKFGRKFDKTTVGVTKK